MKRILGVILALSCLSFAQTRRAPTLPINNIPVDDNDAVTKKYVDDRTPPLATNGTNCPEGQFPRGVDEAGNVEDCTAVDTTTDLTWPLTSNTANPATVGQFRLSYADSIAWRNALNTANYTLNPDADGFLVWSGSGFRSSGEGAGVWIAPTGTCGAAPADNGQICFDTTDDRPVWGYSEGVNKKFLLEGDASGSSATADALTNNPTDCAANQYAHTIAANGNLTCSAIADADVPDNITITKATYWTATVFFPGVADGSEVVVYVGSSAYTVTIPAGLTNWKAYITTNPSTTKTYSFKKNGTEFGTLDITSGGSLTWTSASGASIGADDRLSILSPSDSTLANVNITIQGTK